MIIENTMLENQEAENHIDIKSIALLYTTIDTIENANSLANQAISSNYAACVNILPITSVYKWNNEIENSQEFSLIFKTTPQNIAALEALISESHPYDIPAIIKFNGTTSEDFFEYLASNTQKNNL